MEFERKIYKEILKWKENSNGKSALLIEGARRVGKSTIARKVGSTYKSFIVIDFSRASKNIKDIFENGLNNLDIFFQVISLEYNTSLYNRQSLIIFDEVQLFPKARETIKLLVEDGRYDYIETGSLISLKENVKDILIPSEEEKIKMYPLDFEEFLWALDEKMLADYIRDCYEKKVPLIDAFHKKATYAFNEYILVGGMPQSVDAYVSNQRNFEKAHNEKKRIIELYKDDIKKSANKYMSKASSIFENIPSYLSKHDKKISFNNLNPGTRYSIYDEPLFWLEDSMICNLCYKCNDPSAGLSLNKDESSVKCYMGDTGLLTSMILNENSIVPNELYKKILSGKVNFNKGMLYENVVAQSLKFKNKQLYFYTLYDYEKKRNNIEIDFLLSDVQSGKVVPIEVKSSKNYTNISYDKFKNRFNKRIGTSYIIHPKAFSKDENGYKVPAYMLFAMFEN